MMFPVGLYVAGCATAPITPETSATDHWSGRLALTIATEPPQSFFASFELSGDPQSGELHLASPLGSTLAIVRWQPDRAELHQGDQMREYGTLEALVTELTGTSLPVRALFDWLKGTPQAVDGWQADLARLSDGRLTARRLQPQPTADLRVMIDR